jgi:glycosyltransferase involved in cell wall biosynthesis
MTSSSNRRRRVVFVEQFFHPEGWGGADLPRDVTIHLARQGFDVEVVCGSDQYAKVEGEPAEDPRAAGVRIRRVPRLFGGDYHRRKLLRQLWFYVCVVPLLLLRRRPSLFVLQTNPPLVIVLGACAAAIWRVPLVIISMDLYPEVLFAHGAIRADGRMAAMLTGVFRWAYRRAARVVSLGPVMHERLVQKGVAPERIATIANWSTGAQGVVRGSANRLLDEWQLRGRFVVAYSGNLGIGHEFETFLRGFAGACADAPDLSLVIVGKGNRLDEVRRSVAVLGVGERVRFSGFLPASRLPESIGVADVALVTLRPGFEGVIVPSKLYGYLSRGIPVLYVGPRSDVEVEIVDGDCGRIARNGDADAVRRHLLELYRDRDLLNRLAANAAEIYERRLTAAHALARYTAVVESTAAPGR